MALQGLQRVFAGDLTNVYDDQSEHQVGDLAFSDGNIYVFGKGVAGTVAGSWVTFNHLYDTTLLAANAVGRVGIAQAAIVANKYGWYLRAGTMTGAASDTCAANKALYIDGTAGRVDDAAVTGDLVVNAVSRSADGGTNLITVEIDFPFVTDVLG